MSWRRFLSRSTRDRDRADEMQAHLEHATQHYIDQGMTPDQARRTARLSFGNPRAARERVDDMARLPILDVLTRDLRYAVRMLRRSPVFSVTVIVTLALVIGATSAVFSLADAILLRRLPYPDPDRLAVVRGFTKSPRGESINDAVDRTMWEIVRDRATRIDAAVCIDSAQGVNFVNKNSPSFILNQRVSAGYFRVLGAAPLLGREFTPEEDRAGGPAVALLSHDFWRRAFNGRDDVLGQSILLKGEPFNIIGVMPQEFRSIGGRPDVWTPLMPSTTPEGAGWNFTMIARLRPGATWTDAWTELRRFGKEPFRQNPRLLKDDIYATLTVAPMQQVLTPADVREPIVMLSWAVGVVLLIACVNIAALLLARGGTRAKEIATRMALGSGRGAVVRQLMVESALLAVIGGGLGLAVGMLGLEGLKTIGGTTFTEWNDVSLDGRALAATMGLSLVTSFFFGLVPAWQASRIDVQTALADGGSRSIAGGSRHVMRRVLVVAEVALGVVMLVAAGLLLRQFADLRALDPGFNPANLYSASASLQDARYKDPLEVNRLFSGSIETLRATPGVSAASVSQRLPYQRLLNVGVTVDGRERKDNDPRRITNVAYVTPGFFETFGIPIRSGRALSDQDRAGAVPAVVVNEMFAKIYFPGEPVLGRRLHIVDAVREIVGVSADVQQFGSGFSMPGMAAGPVRSTPTVYVSAPQTRAGLFAWFEPVWTVRAGSAAEAAAAITRAVHAVDPLMPVGDVRSMAQVTDTSIAPERLMMSLVGVLAAAALLLAAIGLHGLIAHAVSERTREFGIRLALGATPGQTIAGVALSGVVLAGIGAIVGGALSVPAAKLIETFLYTVTTKDTTTYIGVAVLLFVVAAVSSVLPALRILKLDPAKTLRE